MTDTHVPATGDERIFDLADQLVAQANMATDQGLSPGEVHQALMYASARYGAFIVAASSESKADFKEDKLEARNFYLDQFRQLLNDNFDDYLHHYEHYLGEDQ